MTKQFRQGEKSVVEYKNIVYNKLFSLDYTSDFDDKVMIELPFSFYHWKLLETT